MKLDKWQRELLAHKGNLLLCTGRQVGKTTIFSIKAGKRMLEKKTSIVVVSLTEDQAQLIITMIMTYLEKVAPTKIKQGTQRPTKNRIRLINGSEVISRPVGITGNSVRGFTGDVLIVDEASRMPESVWTATKPILLTTAGELWLCSTPYGRKGYFWECFNNPERYKIFHISSEEVIFNRPVSEGWTQEQKDKGVDFLRQEKKDMTKTRYGQEYLGLFLEELQQFFPDEVILNCMSLKRPENVQKSKKYYLGVDLARMGEDESTFEIVYRTDSNKLIQVENQITKRTLLSQSTSYIINLDNQYNFEKILIDDEGIGVGVFDFLLDNEQTKRKVIPINNSKRVIDPKGKVVRLLKQDLYQNLLSLMERGEISFLDDDNIFQSLKSVQYEYVISDKGKSHLKIFGNYTHIVEGLIRAAWCIKYKTLNLWIKSIRV